MPALLPEVRFGKRQREPAPTSRRGSPYHGAGGRLHDPRVLGADEAQAVEGGQVAAALLFQPPQRAHLPAEARAVLEHHGARCKENTRDLSASAARILQSG